MTCDTFVEDLLSGITIVLLSVFLFVAFLSCIVYRLFISRKNDTCEHCDEKTILLQPYRENQSLPHTQQCTICDNQNLSIEQNTIVFRGAIIRVFLILGFLNFIIVAFSVIDCYPTTPTDLFHTIPRGISIIFCVFTLMMIPFYCAKKIKIRQ